MAKRKDLIPSKEDILAFIRKHTGKVGKREIAREFGLKGSDRIGLKRLLAELAEEGAIDNRKKRIHKPGELPPVVVVDIVRRDADGEFLARPPEWDEDEHGPAPLVRIQLSRHMKGPAPGINDRVLVRTDRLEDEDGVRYSGRVIKLLDKGRTRTVGIYRRSPAGIAHFVPVDKKQLGREIPIREGDGADAIDGELIAVEVSKGGRFGNPTAKVVERLGSMQTEHAISLVAIHTHGIPHSFPAEVTREAEAARPAALKGREDWRELPLLTIDPADAKDHDDAVHAAADSDPANVGGFIVTVAIADVASYVRPGSALDNEALERGNSVYFPDRVVPLLPERISNDLCSLKPGVDRAALAVRMVIAVDGRKRAHSFHRILMRSAGKLAYPQAQAAIDGKPDDITSPLLEPALKPLWAAWKLVKVARDHRGPLELDLPERKILLKPDGTVDRVVVPERLEAHRLIEDFMILANVAAAEELEAKHTPLIYRVHDAPALEKLAALREFLKTLDISLPQANTVKPAQFNGVLAKVRGTNSETLVNEVVLRSQAQAEYAADNYGHFGLALRRYAHFTSPIRRYADLVVHRALIRALKLGEDGLPDAQGPTELAEVAARISAAERRAMIAERETVDRLIAHWLADRIGATFEGRIGGVTKAGLFVKLKDTGADGFIPASTIGADYYRYDEREHALIGNRTGEMYRLGDPVTVKLVEAVPMAGALRFELLSDGIVDTSKRLDRDSRRPQKFRSEREPGNKRPGRAPGRSAPSKSKPRSPRAR